LRITTRTTPPTARSTSTNPTDLPDGYHKSSALDPEGV